MVAVVGRLFQKWFPASPNLAYTFIWDKTDAYNQKVYGLSEAVGKFYTGLFCIQKNCREVITNMKLIVTMEICGQTERKAVRLALGSYKLVD